MSSGWTVVVKKKRKVTTSVSDHIVKLSRDFVINIISYVLQPYNIHGIFLYGSTAKGTNKTSSDVDILVIWKKKVPDNVNDIKLMLETKFGRPVDFVSMIFRNRLITEPLDTLHPTEPNSFFLDNVISEAVTITGNPKDIYLSEYVGKIEKCR
jgi:predicted nucleotidyltransferase